MVTAFLSAVAPSTFFPVMMLIKRTAKRESTVTVIAPPTNQAAIPSAGCSLIGGSGVAWRTYLRAAPVKKTRMVITNAPKQIQNMTQYSHSILPACGATGLRVECLPGLSGDA